MRFSLDEEGVSKTRLHGPMHSLSVCVSPERGTGGVPYDSSATQSELTLP